MANAQSNYIPQVIPPSPQSQLYEKYVDCPVSYETGVPQIIIPLYEINIDGMKIPINLSYHASGIKYKQFDGDIAVGWVLNPGYRITRVGYNKPDESFDRRSIYDSTQASWYDQFYASFGYYDTTTPDSDTGKYYDSEYDQFTYMLPSRSAHFVISDRYRKEVTILEQENDKIEYLTSPYSVHSDMVEIDQFNITDDKGFQYKMGEKGGIFERTNAYYIPYRSAWPLLKMTSPNNQYVNFEYIQNFQNRTDPNRGMTTFYDEIKHDPYATPAHVVERQISSITCMPFFLSKMETEQEEVKIIRNTASGQNARITSIEIYRKIPNHTLIKKIKFYYSTTLNHCMLNAVEIQGEASSDTQTYKMTYYPGISHAYSYPDQWGYYHQTGLSTDLRDAHWFHYDFANDYGQTSSGFPERIGNRLSYQKDRSSNSSSTLHAYSLKTITFPTQGRWEFDYEPNRYLKSSTQLVFGGGQRIKQITMYSEGTNKAKISQYKYGKNEIGTGIASFHPLAKHFADESLYIEYKDVGSYNRCTPGFIRIYSTDMMGNASMDKHFYIYYPEVAEYIYDEVQRKNNGKTIRTYNEYYPTFRLADVPEKVYLDQQHNTAGSNGNTGAYIDDYRYGFKPRITSTSVFLSNGSNYDLQSKEEYEYLPIGTGKTFQNFMVSKVVFTNQFFTTHEDENQRLYEYKSSLYYHFEYNIYSGREVLTKKINTLFTPQGNVVSTETYQYDSMNRIIKTTQANSANGIIEKTMTYPMASTHPGLVNKNMVSTVIETLTKQNNQETEKVKNIYASNDILPASIQTSSGTLREVVKFDGYNSLGNILGYTGIDNVSTTYVWGYKGNYPIAEIKNAKYSDVSSKINFNTYFNKTTLSDTDINQLMSLQTSLPGSQVTVYTYKPLIGITSITDPKGFRTYFDYDSFGRLKETYFKEGSVKRIIEAYKYNYKNQ